MTKVLSPTLPPEGVEWANRWAELENAFVALEAERDLLKTEVGQLRRQKVDQTVSDLSNSAKAALIDSKELKELRAELDEARRQADARLGEVVVERDRSAKLSEELQKRTAALSTMSTDKLSLQYEKNRSDAELLPIKEARDRLQLEKDEAERLTEELRAELVAVTEERTKFYNEKLDNRRELSQALEAAKADAAFYQKEAREARELQNVERQQAAEIDRKLKEKIEEFAGERASLEEKLHNRKEQLDRMSSLKDSAQEQLAEAHKSKEAAEKAKAKAGDDAKDLKVRVSDLEDKLTTVENEHEDLLRQRLPGASSGLLPEGFGSLAELVREATSAREEALRERQSREHLQEVLQEVEREVRARYPALMGQREEAERLRRLSAQLTQQNEGLLVQAQELETKNHTAEARVRKAERSEHILEAHARDIAKQLAILVHENRRLSGSSPTVASGLSDLEALEADRRAFRTVQDLVEQNEALKKSVARLSGECETEAQRELQESREEFAQQEEAVKKHLSDKAEQIKALADTVKRVTQERDELQRAMKKLQASESEMQPAASAGAAPNAASGVSSGKSGSASGGTSVAGRDIALLRDQLTAVREEFAKCSERLYAEVKELRTSELKARQELATTKGQLDFEMRRKGDLEVSLQQAEKKLQELKTQLKRHEDRVVALEDSRRKEEPFLAIDEYFADLLLAFLSLVLSARWIGSWALCLPGIDLQEFIFLSIHDWSRIILYFFCKLSASREPQAAPGSQQESGYPVTDNASVVPNGSTSNDGSASASSEQGPVVQQELEAGGVRAKERSEVADLERHLDAAKARASSPSRLEHSTSFCDAENRFRQAPELAQQRQLREPGGFRRQFLNTAAEAEGRMTFFDDLPDDGPDQEVAAITVFKGNVGAAILFAPRSFSIGGWAASLVIFTAMFLLAVFCALRLLACALQSGGTYGELVEKSLGRYGRNTCCVAIIMLQSGTCALYFIFMGQVFVELVMPSMPLAAAITILAVVLSPVAMIRKISKLWLANLLGTICAAIGVFCVIGIAGKEASARVNYWEERALAKPSAMLTLGSASFMFEGIGLVIPTFESSKEPQRYPFIFASVMLLVWVLVISVGLLGYLAYGEEVQPLILLNFTSGLVPDSIRMLFAFAMFCSFPLQLLPAVRLVESGFFTPVSNPTLARKCQKNVFRAGYVAILGLVAILGSTSLDSFVSLIGASFGCPLAFVFPLACHYQLVAQSRFEKGVDLLLGVAGSVITLVVSALSIASWKCCSRISRFAFYSGQSQKSGRVYTVCVCFVELDLARSMLLGASDGEAEAVGQLAMQKIPAICGLVLESGKEGQEPATKGGHVDMQLKVERSKVSDLERSNTTLLAEKTSHGQLIVDLQARMSQESEAYREMKKDLEAGYKREEVLLREQLELSQKRQEDFSRTIEELSAARAAREAEAIEAKARVQQLEVSAAKLEEKLTQSSQEIHELREAGAARPRRGSDVAAEAKSQLERSQASWERGGEGTASSPADLARLEKQLRHFEEREKEHDKSSEIWQTLLAQHEADLKTAREEAARLQSELDEFKGLQATKAQESEKARGQQSELEAKLVALGAESRDLRGQLDSKEAEVVAARLEGEQKAREAGEKLEATQRANAGARDEEIQWERQYRDVLGLHARDAKELDILRERLTEVERHSAEINRQRLDLEGEAERARAERSDQLQKRLEQAEQHAKALGDENHRYQEHLLTLSDSRLHGESGLTGDAAAAAEATQQRIAAELRKAREINELQRRSLEMDKEHWQREAKALRVEAQELRERLDREQREVLRLQAETRLEQRAVAKLGQLELLEDEKRRLEAEVKSFESRLDDISKETEDKRSQAEPLEKTLSGLKEQLEESERAIKAAEAKSDEWKQQYDDMVTKFDAKDVQELKRLQGEAAKWQAQRTDLTAKLEKLQEELKQRTHEAASSQGLKARIDEVQKSLNEANTKNQELAKAKEQLQALMKSKDDFSTKQANELKSQLSLKQLHTKKISDLEADLVKLRDEKNKLAQEAEKGPAQAQSLKKLEADLVLSRKQGDRAIALAMDFQRAVQALQVEAGKMETERDAEVQKHQSKDVKLLETVKELEQLRQAKAAQAETSPVQADGTPLQLPGFGFGLAAPSPGPAAAGLGSPSAAGVGAGAKRKAEEQPAPGQAPAGSSPVAKAAAAADTFAAERLAKAGKAAGVSDAATAATAGAASAASTATAASTTLPVATASAAAVAAKPPGVPAVKRIPAPKVALGGLAPPAAGGMPRPAAPPAVAAGTGGASNVVSGLQPPPGLPPAVAPGTAVTPAKAATVGAAAATGTPVVAPVNPPAAA
ncbi:unnamed protein product, partial [Polarella glacialis]